MLKEVIYWIYYNCHIIVINKWIVFVYIYSTCWTIVLKNCCCRLQSILFLLLSIIDSSICCDLYWLEYIFVSFSCYLVRHLIFHRFEFFLVRIDICGWGCLLLSFGRRRLSKNLLLASVRCTASVCPSSIVLRYSTTVVEERGNSIRLHEVFYWISVSWACRKTSTVLVRPHTLNSFFDIQRVLRKYSWKLFSPYLWQLVLVNILR